MTLEKAVRRKTGRPFCFVETAEIAPEEEVFSVLLPRRWCAVGRGWAFEFFDVDVIEEQGGEGDEVDGFFGAIGVFHGLREGLFTVDPEGPLGADAFDHKLMPCAEFEGVVVLAVDTGDFERPEGFEDIGWAVAFTDVFWVVFVVGEVSFADGDAGVSLIFWRSGIDVSNVPDGDAGFDGRECSVDEHREARVFVEEPDLVGDADVVRFELGVDGFSVSFPGVFGVVVDAEKCSVFEFPSFRDIPVGEVELGSVDCGG